MCSIGEDDFGDEGAAHAMLPESSATSVAVSAGECTKCGLTSNALYKLTFRAAECHECFLNYARHKFRAALGASKVLPRNSEVLLLVNGTAESLVLLDMLHFAQTQNNFKRLHCNVRVLFIDKRLDSTECDPLPALMELTRRYAPFQFYAIQFDADPNRLQLLQDYKPYFTDTKFREVNNLTACQDYARQKHKILIGAVAAKLQCSHIFEPCISTNLAAQLLTSVALGRGGCVALDVALLDDRMQNEIKLIRPLKDLSEQEVLFYVHAQQLHTFETNDPSLSSDASIQSLTTAFVANLQQNYAATVSTIFRTGDKIATNCQASVELPTKCALCKSALDNGLSTTLLAIEYSRAVSEVGLALKEHSNVEALEQRAKSRLSATNNLCHPCRNIQAEFSSSIL